ncbi:MAG: hydroxysqualene dehydroxylase HpnE [Gemmataceae bacterium]
MAERVIVIGGGLAGLAAAQLLAVEGKSVTVLESRNRLGGRAGSFVDATTGQVIDACQHVSMGCCTKLAQFFRIVGVAHLLETQPELYFLTPDGRMSRFAAKRLPVPFHLAPAFWRLHFLTFPEKLRIAYGLFCLRFARGDPPFHDWLLHHRQTQRTIDRFWSVVLVSALNESVDRIGLKYARKVFVDGFLTDRRGSEVQIPKVPLDRLYGEEMQAWFEKHGVEIHLNAGVKSINVVNREVADLSLRNGERLKAEWYVAALLPERLLDLLPSDEVDREPVFHNLRQLEYSPIVSVHLWLDRPVMDLPHAVLIDSLSQWVFNRGEYLQVVISAAKDQRGENVTERVIDELRQFFPRMREATVLRSRVVTEHSATFSVVPGVDQIRPWPRSPIFNLFLAGDWTATGWPATMESAVRSGYAAAELIS